MTDASLLEAVQNAIDWALPGEDAKAAIAAVRRWEAENGWRCVPKEWSPEMWKVWEECEGGGEMEFQAVVSSSPPPPGSVKGVKE